jgi:hypothetical protein
MFNKIYRKIKSLDDGLKRVNSVKEFLFNDLKSPKVNLGQIQAHLNSQKEHIDRLSEVEFQVFSQWGDDGIIQYLVQKLRISNKTFIEFGVEDYRESNTRFLLFNNNWSGYVLDGSQANVDVIKGDRISWSSELRAKCSFITKENINALIMEAGFHEDVGILSIDIDGNDYWVWEAISCIRPIITIVEYNALFGSNTSWTIPYKADFVRSRAETISYYGASLKALVSLGKKKGYSFVGCNSKGNNAYFLRDDMVGNFVSVKNAQEGYEFCQFREAIVAGERLLGRSKLKPIEGLEVLDLETGKMTKIASDKITF